MSAEKEIKSPFAFEVKQAITSYLEKRGSKLGVEYLLAIGILQTHEIPSPTSFNFDPYEFCQLLNNEKPLKGHLTSIFAEMLVDNPLRLPRNLLLEPDQRSLFIMSTSLDIGELEALRERKKMRKTSRKEIDAEIYRLTQLKNDLIEKNPFLK